jgi:diaminohydroxyphosphoribosylaminopyrimidine deaminase/5-amino-6-(5-phosphoribosylamino)uracil reductase
MRPSRKTPPCADLVIEKGIPKVVVAVLDPNPRCRGKVSKDEASGIEVTVGTLERMPRI